MASIINQTSPSPPQPEPLKGKLNHIKELLNDANQRLNQEAKVFTTKTSASPTTNLKGRNGNQRHLQAEELRRTIADISTIQSVLSCPIFDQITNVTDSLDQLSYHLNLRPSIGPSDIEFNDNGEIILAPPIESTSLNNLINSRLDDFSNSQPNGIDNLNVDFSMQQSDKQHGHNHQLQSKPNYYSLANVATQENRPMSMTTQDSQVHEPRNVVNNRHRAERVLSSNSNQRNEYDTERLVTNSRETNYVNNRQRKKEPSKVQSVVAVFENADALAANNNGTRNLYKANGYQALNQIFPEAKENSDQAHSAEIEPTLATDDTSQSIGFTNQLYKSTHEVINSRLLDESDSVPSQNTQSTFYANGTRDQHRAMGGPQTDLVTNGKSLNGKASNNKRVSPSISAGSTVRLADECDSGTSSFRSKGALYSPQSHRPIDQLDDDPVVSSSAHSSIDQELIEKLSRDMERIKVTLEKDSDGLGITIAGYTCEQEEISGIFIKSITPGSPADRSGKIRILDQIFAVNGQEILAYSNPEAVNVLRRQTGRVVTLELMRYLAESKYRKLQTLLDRAEPLKKQSASRGSKTGVPMEIDLQPTKAQPVMSSSSPKCPVPKQTTESVYNNTSALLEQQPFEYNSDATSPIPVAAQRLSSSTSKVIETKQGARNKIEIRSPFCQATYVNEIRPPEFNSSYNQNNLQSITDRLTQETDEFSRLVDSEKLRWEKNIQIVSLKKDSNQSLGFTVKDYVNPRDSQRWMLMINSITPNSITDQNGQLSVGDQLVFVDDTNLECSTPEEAAKAISRASGEVRLGILKFVQQK